MWLFETSKRRTMILVLIMILIITFLGVVNAKSLDGVVWMDAGRNFFDALGRGDFVSTHYSSRFGVSVMWLYGVATLISRVSLFSVVTVLTTLIFLITVCGVTIFSFRLKKSIGRTLPIFTITTYLLLAPYVVSSPIFVTWLDKVLTMSTLLCVVFWTEYLMVRPKTWLVLATGVSCGIAFLTKPSGFILVPVLFPMTAYVAWRQRSFRSLRVLLWVFIIAVALFVLLYPAMWVDPLSVLLSRMQSSDAKVVLTVPGFMDNGFVRYVSNVVVVFLADLMFTIGVGMIVIDAINAFRKKQFGSFLTPATFLSVSGVIYAGIVALIAIFIVDRDFGNIVSPRYFAPAIPLVVIYPLTKLRNHRLVLVLAFIIQIYRLPMVRWTLWVVVYLLTGSVILFPYW